jgi:Family of unknown function (DUF5522)
VILNAADAVHNAHTWFETNSGWAPPDPETLAEWIADGVCRCPDECLVAPEAWCRHGLASWWLILSTLDQSGHVDQLRPEILTPHPSRLDPDRPDYPAIMAAHRQAVAAGEPGYTDPTTGLFVMTARFLWERGYCCDQGCRHCPFLVRE